MLLGGSLHHKNLLQCFYYYYYYVMYLFFFPPIFQMCFHCWTEFESSLSMFSPPFVLKNYLTLLDDEDHTLESLKIQDEQQLVIEGMKRLPFFIKNCLHTSVIADRE